MLSSEVLTLESLHHPNILRLFEVIDMWNRVYLITEFVAGGELYNKISLDGPVRESQAIVLFRQLLDAVKYMHAKSFVHRDIKAENVLLISETKVKLADFGFSTQLKEPLEKLDTFCGSPPYAAPELFTEDHYIGQFVDIWALGVLLYFMVVGNMPFRAPTVPALRAAVLKGHYLLPSTLTEPCGRVIQRILVQTPAHRPTLDDLAGSQWMVWGSHGGRGEQIKGATTTRKTLSQWLLFRRSSNGSSSPSNSSSTNRNHSRRRRVEEVIPIACTTKRTESVFQARYLFPIELDDETGGGEPTSMAKGDSGGVVGGLFKRPRRSVFSLKTKIGPMDSVLIPSTKKEKGESNGQPINSNNNNNIIDTTTATITAGGGVVDSSVYSGDHKGTHSAETDGVKAKEKGDEEKLTLTTNFEMVPTIDSSSSAEKQAKSAIEIEALRLLNNWGISQSMLVQVVDRGARSDLMGIYRIVVHRLQVQQERQAKSQQNTKEAAGNTKKSTVQKTKKGKTKTPKTDTVSGEGVGVGCGGKCTGTSSKCVIL